MAYRLQYSHGQIPALFNSCGETIADFATVDIAGMPIAYEMGPGIDTTLVIY